MTEPEFKEVAAVLQAGVERNFQREQLRVWFEVLKDLPAEAVQAGMIKYLAEAEYPGFPPIGKIRRLATEAVHGIIPPWTVAWQQVRRAVRRFGSWWKAEALNSLDPWARVTAERLGWNYICQTDEPEIVAAQFRMAYERLATDEERMRRLPEAVRPAIASQPNYLALPDMNEVDEDIVASVQEG